MNCSGPKLCYRSYLNLIWLWFSSNFEIFYVTEESLQPVYNLLAISSITYFTRLLTYYDSASQKSLHCRRITATLSFNSTDCSYNEFVSVSSINEECDDDSSEDKRRQLWTFLCIHLFYDKPLMSSNIKHFTS